MRFVRGFRKLIAFVICAIMRGFDIIDNGTFGIAIGAFMGSNAANHIADKIIEKKNGGNKSAQ